MHVRGKDGYLGRNEAIPVMEAGGRVKIHRCTMFIH